MTPCEFRYMPKKIKVAASAISTILDWYQGLVVAEIAITVFYV